MPAIASRLALLLFAVSAFPAFAQPGFGTRTDIPIGSLPREVALADLNQDGHLDLVAACEGESFVGTFLGNGDGTFGPRAEIPTEFGPRSMAVVDWNGDGKLDILVYASGALQLSSFLGQGDGTFVPGPSVALPAPITRLATGDLDGDGILDLAASTDFGVTRLFTVAGTGGGGFGTPAGLDSLGGSQSYDLAIAQLDGQGAPDIFLPLTCTCPSHLLIGQGGGAFASPVNVTGTVHSQGVAVTDLGNNGILDLIVTDAGTSTANGGMRVLVGLGGGQFAVGGLVGTGRGAGAVAVGPWGGAGETDVVIANASVGNVTLARVLCDGSVIGKQNQVVGAVPVDVAIGDIDEDGVADIVTANQAANTATIQLMTPNLSPATCNPQASISTNLLDFGSNAQGIVSGKVVSISNVGNAGFDVSSVTRSGSTEFNPFPGALPRHLSPGEHLDILVNYLRATLGTATGSLLITTTEGHQFEVDLVGKTTAAQAKLQVDTSPFDFGSDFVNVTEDAAVIVHSVGNLSLSVHASLDDPQFSLVGSSDVSIPVGTQDTIRVRYLRSQPGDAATTLMLVTNDPDQPEVTIEFTGNAKPRFERIELGATLLDYGAKFQDTVEDKTVAIKNTGLATLTVLGLSTTGSPDFSVLAPGTPFTIAPGVSVNRTVRYSRATLGDASGTLHVASSDSLTPDATVALTGSATLKPAIVASAPPRASVSVGATTTVEILVRNNGLGPLSFTPAVAGTDLAEVSPLDLGPTALPHVRGAWDLQADGSIAQGATGEFKGAFDLVGFPPQATATLGLGGREVRIGPAPLGGGLVATRKVWFASDAIVRWANVIENPTGAPVATTLILPDTIGYFPGVPVVTSSGNGSFTIDDSWVVFPPDGAPERRAAGRVSRTTVAPHAPTVSNYAQNFFGYEVRLRYGLTVPEHGRVVVLGWGIQGGSTGESTDEAAAIAAGAPEAFEGLAALDRASLWNAPAAPSVFHTAGLPIDVAPGDSAVVVVTCDATAAAYDAAIDGTLKIVSNDPDHPELYVPVGFDVSGGTVVGVPPPSGTDAPAPVLALAGLVPNPATRSGSLRVSFTLANSSPATLTLYDVRGRALAKRTIASPAPGPGSLALTGTSLKAGVVWMRLEQGGRIATGKGIVLP